MKRPSTMTTDDETFEHYANPDNLIPAGPGRSRAAKSTHVPIRFTPEMVAEVKQLAKVDRKTVSTWIRDVVSAEVERRCPRRSESHASSAGQNFVTNASSGLTSFTVSHAALGYVNASAEALRKAHWMLTHPLRKGAAKLAVRVWKLQQEALKLAEEIERVQKT